MNPRIYRAAHTAFLSLFILFVGSQPTTAQSTGAARPRIEGALTLDRAIATALQHSPSIAAMSAEARAARAEGRMARSMSRPQVSANTFASTGTMSNILASPPGIDPAGSVIAPDKPFVDQNVTMMVPIYTGGRLRGQIRAADERGRAAESDVDTERAETILMVRDAYLKAQLSEEMVAVAQARLAAAEEMVRTTRAQLEVGKGIEASVQRAEAERADAQRMVTSARNDRAKMLLELKAAMGVDLTSVITLQDKLSHSGIDRSLDAVLAEANASRPELIAARLRVAAAEAQVAAARGAQRPQVYGMAMADALKMRGMPGEAGYTVGVTVGLPLLDGGQRRAEVAQMQAMQQAAEARVQSLAIRVESEVRQAWLDIDTAEQNYRTAQAALQAAQAAYDVVLLRVESQKSIQVEQLDALAALTQARANVAQALYDHSIAVARLQRAIGKE